MIKNALSLIHSTRMFATFLVNLLVLFLIYPTQQILELSKVCIKRMIGALCLSAKKSIFLQFVKRPALAGAFLYLAVTGRVGAGHGVASW